MWQLKAAKGTFFIKTIKEVYFILLDRQGDDLFNLRFALLQLFSIILSLLANKFANLKFFCFLFSKDLIWGLAIQRTH